MIDYYENERWVLFSQQGPYCFVIVSQLVSGALAPYLT